MTVRSGGEGASSAVKDRYPVPRESDMRASAFESLHVPLLVIDRGFRIVAANAAACEMFAAPRESLVGQHCYRLTHHREVPCWEAEDSCCPVRSAFGTGERARSIHLHDFDGETRTQELIASPLRAPDGSVSYVVEEWRSEAATLDGIIAICSVCKRVRDSQGRWEHIEAYLSDHSTTRLSHSYCPDCHVTSLPRRRTGSSR